MDSQICVLDLSPHSSFISQFFLCHITLFSNFTDPRPLKTFLINVLGDDTSSNISAKLTIYPKPEAMFTEILIVWAQHKPPSSFEIWYTVNGKKIYVYIVLFIWPTCCILIVGQNALLNDKIRDHGRLATEWLP